MEASVEKELRMLTQTTNKTHQDYGQAISRPLALQPLPELYVHVTHDTSTR